MVCVYVFVGWSDREMAGLFHSLLNYVMRWSFSQFVLWRVDVLADDDIVWCWPCSVFMVYAGKSGLCSGPLQLGQYLSPTGQAAWCPYTLQAGYQVSPACNTMACLCLPPWKLYGESCPLCLAHKLVLEQWSDFTLTAALVKKSTVHSN